MIPICSQRSKPARKIGVVWRHSCEVLIMFLFPLPPFLCPETLLSWSRSLSSHVCSIPATQGTEVCYWAHSHQGLDLFLSDPKVVFRRGLLGDDSMVMMVGECSTEPRGDGALRILIRHTTEAAACGVYRGRPDLPGETTLPRSSPSCPLPPPHPCLRVLRRMGDPYPASCPWPEWPRCIAQGRPGPGAQRGPTQMGS